MTLLQLAACIFQQMVFWMGGNSGHSLGWAGLAEGGRIIPLWVFRGEGLWAEACHSSKIV